MAIGNIGLNFNDVIGRLSDLRRRSQLTGQPFSNRDVTNVMEPYFASAREAGPANAALNLQGEQLDLEREKLDTANQQFGQSLEESKRQAAERINAERMNAQEAMDQARRLNLVNASISGTGAALMGAHLLKPAAGPGPIAVNQSGAVPTFTAQQTGAGTPWWSGASGPATGAAIYAGSRMTGNALDETKEVPKEAVTVLKYPATGMGSVAGGELASATGIREIAEPFNFAKSVEDTFQQVIGGGK